MDQLSRKRGHVLLLFVAALLIATNGLLLYQNLQLRKSVEQSKRFVTDVGYRFSAISGTSLTGVDQPVVFGQDGKSTILMVFDVNCGYCIQQYPNWKRLVDTLDRRTWRIVALTSQNDDTVVRKHLGENGLSDVDVRMVSREEISNARIGFTPMTLVIDPNGVVQSVFPGLWTGDFF